jgi:hypothetical protein
MPGARRCLFLERELRDWLDGAALQTVQLPDGGRIVRIAEGIANAILWLLAELKATIVPKP